MSFISTLQEIIQKHDLNQTQFYQAWSRWELSMDALKSYANEYGNFIGTLGAGWATLGNATQAQVEDDHYAIWSSDFCSALQTTVGEIVISEVQDLMSSATSMFSERVSALAALYVFIGQQATTSQAKLEWLRKHYDVSERSESYFIEHLNTDRIMQLLSDDISELSEEESKVLFEKAEEFAEKLCIALDAIYARYHSEKMCATT